MIRPLLRSGKSNSWLRLELVVMVSKKAGLPQEKSDCFTHITSRHKTHISGEHWHWTLMVICGIVHYGYHLWKNTSTGMSINAYSFLLLPFCGTINENRFIMVRFLSLHPSRSHPILLDVHSIQM